MYALYLFFRRRASCACVHVLCVRWSLIGNTFFSPSFVVYFRKDTTDRMTMTTLTNECRVSNYLMCTFCLPFCVSQCLRLFHFHHHHLVLLLLLFSSLPSRMLLLLNHWNPIYTYYVCLFCMVHHHQSTGVPHVVLVSIERKLQQQRYIEMTTAATTTTTNKYKKRNKTNGNFWNHCT